MVSSLTCKDTATKEIGSMTVKKGLASRRGKQANRNMLETFLTARKMATVVTSGIKGVTTKEISKTDTSMGKERITSQI